MSEPETMVEIELNREQWDLVLGSIEIAIAVLNGRLGVKNPERELSHLWHARDMIKYAVRTIAARPKPA